MERALENGPIPGWAAPQTMPLDPRWYVDAPWWRSADADVLRAGMEILQLAWMSGGFVPANTAELASRLFMRPEFLRAHAAELFDGWVPVRGETLWAHPLMARLCHAIYADHEQAMLDLVAQQAVMVLGGTMDSRRRRKTQIPQSFGLTSERRDFLRSLGVESPEEQEQIFGDFVKYARESRRTEYSWDFYFEKNVSFIVERRHNNRARSAGVPGHNLQVIASVMQRRQAANSESRQDSTSSGLFGAMGERR
jgi:hypothetical protein